MSYDPALGYDPDAARRATYQAVQDYLQMYPHPATEPQPATLQDYLHAEHAFYLMRKHELDRQSGMQHSAALVGEVK